ncbi:E3 ubiquitin-protein ligase AMFR isoform X1 [Megalobrama amblycephala]|uniref:E3 ubiquitin-protein ligase AMFR isoform X1 n=1 Tax=Megalobrama amblycephala TaxID=75352 RepID=UPI0020147D14|nr:E3 ubiquitin-protein ligase AMFR isoform X1 [Megalobrama amblycephala]XP_048040570.1 E3 ubiquitin-protein ligase AMFR isoform X1 [Megalobrama amblycephala]
MALSVVDVLSWPWAKAYTTFSVCLLTRCIYNLYEEAKDPLIQTALVNKLSQNSPDGRIGDDNVNNEELHSTVLWYQATDSFCIWVLVNTLCCFLLLMAKCIQFIVFSDLRMNEKQNLKGKIRNFLFYKFIFLFGVLNVQTERELAMWCVWCSALLFLQLLAQLCKDRFEYLSSSSTTTLASHMRVLSVLMCLFVSSGGLTVICGLLGFFSHDMHTLSFMAVECLMVTIYMSHAILRYTIHLYDLICEDSWEDKEVCIYYTDFVMEMGILFLDMMHHIHMLLYGNIWFSVADLIILTHLRFLSQEMQHRLLQHKNYLHIYDVMDMRFSMATMEELASHDDRCAICWEKMYTAYKLPCGHLFHKSCLRAWLEQDMSCPTCRMSVNMSGSQTRNEQEGASLSVSLGPAAVGNPNRAPISYQSHLFYFDGSQIANWLPGLSVEFVHSPNMIILLQADDSQVHQEE